MQIKKKSLANMQGKLSRDEMKNIMAGDEGEGGVGCVEHRGECSKHSDCCNALHACTNNDGEQGKFRCNNS